MKVLKSTRESADDDYKYLVQDFQPFPKGGLSASFLRWRFVLRKVFIKEKNSPLTEYVDNSYIEEALKQLQK